MKKSDFNAILDCIRDYYKKRNIVIDSTSILLEDKYNEGKDVGPFYVTRGNIGAVYFDLSQKDIQSIINGNDEPLDTVYSSSMGYEQLIELITKTYNEEHKTRESLLQVGSLLSELKKAKSDGVIFHISSLYGNGIYMNKSKIKHIIEEQLSKFGFQVLSIKFDEQVLIRFIDSENKVVKEENTPVEETSKLSIIPDSIVTEEIINDSKDNCDKPEEPKDVYDDLAEDLPSTKKVVAKLYTAEVANKTLEQLDRQEKIRKLKEKRLRSILIAILCAYYAIIFAEVREVDKKDYDLGNTFDSAISTVDEFINNMGIAGTGLSVASILSIANSIVKHKELKLELKKKKEFDEQVISNLDDLDKKLD